MGLLLVPPKRKRNNNMGTPHPILIKGPDALLTQKGITQALAVNKAWKSQLTSSIPLPEKFYSSPLSRASSTLNLTFFDITLRNPPYSTPMILENLRESIGLHTCDRRRT